jgi:hypothetical protein
MIIIGEQPGKPHPEPFGIYPQGFPHVWITGIPLFAWLSEVVPRIDRAKSTPKIWNILKIKGFLTSTSSGTPF